MVSKAKKVVCKPNLPAPSSLWVIQDESGQVAITETKPDPKMYPPEKYKITAYGKKTPAKKGGKKDASASGVAKNCWQF
jgi:hypothetical protein